MLYKRKIKKTAKGGRTGRSPEKLGIGPAHARNAILTIFGMWGGPLDVFLKFEFRVGRSQNFGATGGSKSPFSYSRLIAYATACCYRTNCDLYCYFTICKCSLDYAKRSVYRAANDIFGKIGRIASEDVVIQLLKSKCIPCYCMASKCVICQKETFNPSILL